MMYNVSPVVKVAVKVKDGEEMPKLVEGLKKLSKSDPRVVCTTEESGEHVIAGCGGLRVKICFKDLREGYAQCDVTVSDPVVSYHETVNETSGQTCLAKSTPQMPVFLVEITCPQEAICGVYNCMNLRRGCVFEGNPREGTPLVQVKAHLPVAESFGFVAALRQATSGQASTQCIFDHWENLHGDCLQEGSKI